MTDTTTATVQGTPVTFDELGARMAATVGFATVDTDAERKPLKSGPLSGATVIQRTVRQVNLVKHVASYLAGKAAERGEVHEFKGGGWQSPLGEGFCEHAGNGELYVYCSPAVTTLAVRFYVNGVETPAESVTPHLTKKGGGGGDIRMIKVSSVRRFAANGEVLVPTAV